MGERKGKKIEEKNKRETRELKSYMRKEERRWEIEEKG